MKKVNIDKATLIKYYIDEQMTMKEIANLYNVDRTTIGNKLKEYDIKYKDNINLSLIQKELIVGSLLGDASIVSRNKNSYFRVSHCEKQKDYIIWKKEILNNLVNSINKYIDKRGNSIMYSFNTKSSEVFNEYNNLFYKDKKRISYDIYDHLSELGLAVWYMDDGSKQNNNCRLSTDGFSLDENIILQNILDKKFNLNCKICKYNRNNNEYYFLFFNKDNTYKLHNIIDKYVINSMKYKLIL